MKYISSISNVDMEDSSSEDEARPLYIATSATPATESPIKSGHRRLRMRNLHIGRGIKDRLTHTTHEQRELDHIAESEQKRRTREAMERAMATGEKQLVGKDAAGKDVYVEPPSRGQYYDSYGYGAYGYSPYYGYGLGLGVESLLWGSLLFGFW